MHCTLFPNDRAGRAVVGKVEIIGRFRGCSCYVSFLSFSCASAQFVGSARGAIAARRAFARRLRRLGRQMALRSRAPFLSTLHAGTSPRLSQSQYTEVNSRFQTQY